QFLKSDQVYLPLYESKMMHHFDHRFGSFDGIDCRGNSNLPTPSEDAHADASFLTQPWYWVNESEVKKAVGGWERQWFIGLRNVTNPTNERTAIFSIIPVAAVGHSMPLILSRSSAPLTAALIGDLSSLPFDYLARQKVAGVNM